MRVFKFGGASVKDADAVRNLSEILKGSEDDRLVVVISAMGQTTNSLEEVVSSYYEKDGNARKLLNDVRKFHLDIMSALFSDKKAPVFNEVNNLFVEAEWVLDEEPSKGYAFAYDQIVSTGELDSTRIISEYLNSVGTGNVWLDCRGCIRTDSSYREGKVG